MFVVESDNAYRILELDKNATIDQIKNLIVI